jgi:hypothetical protein
MMLYKYTSEAGLKRFLASPRLRFSPPLAFNDPFEIRPVITDEDHADTRPPRQRRKQDELVDFERIPFSPRHHLNSGIGTNIGILCLSATPCEPLMWAHYADCHKGAVIGFDAEHPFFAETRLPAGFLQFLRPVSYSKKRSVLHLSFFRRYQTVEIARTGWFHLLERQDPLFFTKSLNWKYEKEWRLIRQLRAVPDNPTDWSQRIILDAKETDIIRDDQLITVPPEAVKSITLGAKSRMQGPDDIDGLEEETIAALERSSELSHVELWKARLHPRCFSVIRFNLDSRRDLKRNVSPMEFVIRISGSAGRAPRKP